MGTVRTEEFRKDAVRIVFTSGLTRRHVTTFFMLGVTDAQSAGG
jgi:hypothetical protein